MTKNADLNTDDLKLDENLGKFTKHRTQSDAILPAFASTISNQKTFEAICICGSILKFTKYRNLETEETMRELSGANFCKFRFCPMCQWRKARKVCNEVLAKVQSVSNARGGVAFLFLTLTVKNPPMSDLRETVSHLSQSFKRFKETQAFQRAVLGFVRAVEYVGDQTRSGEAHPHFHCLLVVRKTYFKKADYLTKDQWAQMWQNALRVDYTPLVNIQRIKAKGALSDLQAACLEVVKYSVSFSDMSRMTDEDLAEMIKQTKGLRQYALGGEVKEAEPAEIEQFSEEEWERIGTEFFKWTNNQYIKD